MLGGADGGVSGWKQRGWGKQKGRPPLKEEKAQRQGVGAASGSGGGGATDGSEMKTTKRNGS
jgi:hypothetical protein